MNDNDIDVKPIQKTLIDILLEVQRICDKHNIVYYACGGTALGAVRHDGFIPWDDDLDIELMRSEFDRFCGIADKELPNWLRFVSFRTTYGYSNLFAKVQCADENILRKVEKESRRSLPQGLFVDVFPIDSYPQNTWSLLVRVIRRGLLKLMEYAYSSEDELSSRKCRLAMRLGRFLKWMHPGLHNKFEVLCATEKLMKSCPLHASSVVGAATWFSRDFKHLKGELNILYSDYGTPVIHKFETINIPLHCNVDSYLRKRYGDYMRLPPDEQQKPSHGVGPVASWQLGHVKVRCSPLLSIVIANFNYGEFIGQAIQSIISQSSGRAKSVNGRNLIGLPNGVFLELIVCDGGSTDASVDVIKRYQDWIAWWVSEKDTGQSNAFNKGFDNANGKYLTWLNADDMFVPGALLKITDEMLRHTECDWFTGNFFWFSPDKKVTEICWGSHYYPRVLQRRNSPVQVFGPSSFFSKSVYLSAGKIDERFHNIMDTALWIKFIQNGVKQRRVRTLCWAFRLHERSKTAEFSGHERDYRLKERSRRERMILLQETRYVPSKIVWAFIFCWRLLDGSLLKRIGMNLFARNYNSLMRK